MAGLKLSTFRALRQRNFRLFFIGQILSVSGTWAQRVAQSWLAYRLMHSSLYLAYVTFASSAPAFLLTPVAGLIADRMDRRTMLIWAQTFAMLQAVALTVATLSGVITANLLLFLSLVLGVVNAFENPARQSFYSEMVEPQDLPNAIALNASMVNSARVAGPALAGVLVAVWGEGICFGINAASFLAVILALLLMRVKPLPRADGKRRGWLLMRDGFLFVQRTPLLRSMLFNFGIFNLAGSSYTTLMPILAAERLLTGPARLGWLVAASGTGAVVSSLVLAARSGTQGLTGASFAATAVGGIALVFLGISRSFGLSLAMMVLIGAGYSTTLATTQTMMQTWVDETMRGRVMSFYSLVFLGVPPIGSLIAGWFAEKFHATPTLVAGGLICALSALYCGRALSSPATRAEAAPL